MTTSCICGEHSPRVHRQQTGGGAWAPEPLRSSGRAASEKRVPGHALASGSPPSGGGDGSAGDQLAHFFTNESRAAPWSFFSSAWALHAAILSPPPLRQVLMNALRSSPFIPLSDACLLQALMRCCCGVSSFLSWANAGAAHSAAANTAAISFCMGSPPLVSRKAAASGSGRDAH